MKKNLTFVCILVMVISIAGCGSFDGAGPAGGGTSVTLGSNNFTVVATDVVGSASVGVLFPGNFPVIGKLGLPLGDANLYKLAMEDLRKKLPSKDNVGFVNISVDSKLKHYVVYGTQTVTVTADVVQFK